MEELKELIHHFSVNDRVQAEEFFSKANAYISYSRTTNELLNKIAFSVKNHITYMTASQMDILYGRMVRAKNLLVRCSSFEEIFHTMYCCERAEINPEVCYLAALYLGMNYYKDKYYPKYVYLNDRTYRVARELVGENFDKALNYYNDDKEYPYIFKEDMPEEMQELRPYEIEIFLSLNIGDLKVKLAN
ncbi:hypothetical protein [Clostridium cellulovorans]|uniref:Uncharacterized protein n=1 Tax=Clostridium cellulovorans (strain ATCC 35296 / DSM 3052 / OCM 3 / 743B) TaxID=573061 RepID=D9SUA5_CLOC7|nr:hypothetical protein [Clostridium cellulovorans]ADL52860.1 hypothetical protein Clocel_3174 [Clostridium cellulovorans 743B]